MTPLVPDTLVPGALVADRYRVERLLGRGGMGAVYLAEHVELHRKVALKVLLPEIARVPEIVERFFREARAAASIGHPGIVDVIDLGRDGDTAFLAMEALEGEELAALIARQRLPLHELAELGALICDAIAAAHERGIVHRDLKPANVFVLRGSPRRIKVLDFGIAKVNGPVVSGLTQTGQVMGTPVYMSPEAFRDSARVDARTDVYAIGAMLFEMLTGQPPFVADSYPMLVLEVCGGAEANVRSLRSDVPDDLAGVVHQALAKDVDRRTPSVQQLGANLRALSEAGIATSPTLAMSPLIRRAPSSAGMPAPVSWPWRPLAVGAAAIALAVVGVAAFAEGRDEPSAMPPAEAADRPEEPALPPSTLTPPAPLDHRLELDVSPVGATVTSASGESCTAPCVLVFPETPTVLTVTAHAHHPQTIPLSVPLPSRLEIRLERVRTDRRAEPPPLRSP